MCYLLLYMCVARQSWDDSFNLLFFSFYTWDEMQGCDYLFIISPAFLIHNMAVGMLPIFTPIFICRRRRRRRSSTSSSSRLSTHKESERERWHASSHLKIHVCWWMITIHILLCSVDLQDIKTHHIHSQNQSTQTDSLFITLIQCTRGKHEELSFTWIEEKTNL